MLKFKGCPARGKGPSFFGCKAETLIQSFREWPNVPAEPGVLESYGETVPEVHRYGLAQHVNHRGDDQ